MTAKDWYEQGNDMRRQGRFGDAINCYTEALNLDPASPAATAKRMLEQQFDFYCKDYYNP